MRHRDRDRGARKRIIGFYFFFNFKARIEGSESLFISVIMGMVSHIAGNMEEKVICKSAGAVMSCGICEKAVFSSSMFLDQLCF